MSTMNSMMASMKETTAESPDYFEPLEGFVESVEGIVEKTRTYTDEQNVGFDARIAIHEHRVGIMKKLIEALEEHQAEL